MGDAGLPDLDELERILEAHSERLAVRTLCDIRDGERRYPFYAVFGLRDRIWFQRAAYQRNCTGAA